MLSKKFIFCIFSALVLIKWIREAQNLLQGKYSDIKVYVQGKAHMKLWLQKGDKFMLNVFLKIQYIEWKLKHNSVFNKGSLKLWFLASTHITMLNYKVYMFRRQTVFFLLSQRMKGLKETISSSANKFLVSLFKYLAKTLDRFRRMLGCKLIHNELIDVITWM